MRLKTLSQRDQFKLRVPYSSRSTNEDEKVVVWRWQLLTAFSIVFLLAVVYFFLYSSYFKITSVERSKTIFIPEHEVNAVIENFLSTRRYGIFKQNNYFTLDAKALGEVLGSAFRFSKVIVVKDVPNSIFVYFKEQISIFGAADHSGGDTVRMYNHDGTLIQSVAKNDFASELPFVSVETYDVLDENFAKLIIGSWDIVNEAKQNKFRITTYIENGGELVAITDARFEIRFSLEQPSSDQLYNLSILTQSFLRGEPMPNEYIDLRFGEKVYVK